MEDVEVKKPTYYYIVSDDFATGEGRTVYILITRAYPSSEDYDENYKVKSDSTPQFRAMREFIKKHGAWIASGSTPLTKEEFLISYKHYLPEYAIKIILDDRYDNLHPGNFNYSAVLHVNYS